MSNFSTLMQKSEPRKFYIMVQDIPLNPRQPSDHFGFEQQIQLLA